MIATLTGPRRRSPAGHRQARSPGAPPHRRSPPASSATAGAARRPSRRAPAASAAGRPGAAAHARLAGTPPAPRRRRGRGAARQRCRRRSIDLTSAPDALGRGGPGRARRCRSATPRALGHYIVLRDVYGDVFTYAGLGSIAPTLHAAEAAPRAGHLAARRSREHARPGPVAGRERGHPGAADAAGQDAARRRTAGSRPAGRVRTGERRRRPSRHGKVRLFAHPGNPDAARRRRAATRPTARGSRARPRRLPLRARLGRRRAAPCSARCACRRGAHAGHLRFAIRPAGDTSTIDPGPGARQLGPAADGAAPAGREGRRTRCSARPPRTCSCSRRPNSQRTVLSDPGITIYACGRHDVASGAIDQRVLAVLAFLSRSGLKPTVSALRCGQSPVTLAGAASAALPAATRSTSSAINGIPLAGHQGAGDDHRPHDPHAADAAERIRCPRRS